MYERSTQRTDESGVDSLRMDGRSSGSRSAIIVSPLRSGRTVGSGGGCTEAGSEGEAVTDARMELPACAAIQFPNGTIFAGHRHHDCLSMINYSFGHTPPFPKDEWNQGFMTTKGRFVNRSEAFRVMVESGIPSDCPTGYRTRLGELFSEDLY